MSTSSSSSVGTGASSSSTGSAPFFCIVLSSESMVTNWRAPGRKPAAVARLT
eukprot:CAMPEP_0176062806 /NCGR_PEP_ID=MMETSP0120_2-20121206/31320_1 /TAXON_ID=160619 /ORGANISM="Kryptoperidinium foliaceum, Strain CCMP 1326" /LENGTH=51 /DNA_ID=CAMNT_0017396373 /DNA_START=84 /DNA_END=235 /DNA_ORIENTATION=-